MKALVIYEVLTVQYTSGLMYTYRNNEVVNFHYHNPTEKELKELEEKIGERIHEKVRILYWLPLCND